MSAENPKILRAFLCSFATVSAIGGTPQFLKISKMLFRLVNRSSTGPHLTVNRANIVRAFCPPLRYNFSECVRR
jgi:hypothetical protein